MFASTSVPACYLLVCLVLFQECSANMGSPYTDGCGVTKGCFGGPGSCLSPNKSCTYLVTYNVAASTGESGHLVNLQLKLLGDPYNFIAVGFSNDQIMGGDAVVACLVFPNGTAGAIQSFNSPGNASYYLQFSESDQNTILKQSGTWVNGDFLACNVTIESKISSGDAVYDLYNNKYYLILAAGTIGPVDGNATDAQIGKYSSTPLVSPTMVSLININTTQTTGGANGLHLASLTVLLLAVLPVVLVSIL